MSLKPVLPLFLALAFWTSSCQKPYTTSIFYWAPYCVCDLEYPTNSSEIYGIFPGAAAMIYDNLGWVEGTDYTFYCSEFFDAFMRTYTDPQTLWFFTGDLVVNGLQDGVVYVQVTLLVLSNKQGKAFKNFNSLWLNRVSASSTCGMLIPGSTGRF
jgi:hypothetical protein